jgi:hypothetical protein
VSTRHPHEPETDQQQRVVELPSQAPRMGWNPAPKRNDPKWPKVMALVCVLAFLVVAAMILVFLGPGADDDDQPDDVPSPVADTPAVVMRMPNGDVAIKCDGFGFRVYQSKNGVTAVPDVACAGIASVPEATTPPSLP